MIDKHKGHVLHWPKREVNSLEFRNFVYPQRYSTQNFVWLAKGVEHVATVSYDCNGMAIGYIYNDQCFIFD